MLLQDYSAKVFTEHCCTDIFNAGEERNEIVAKRNGNDDLKEQLHQEKEFQLLKKNREIESLTQYMMMPSETT